ncbi:MAG TPA: hypothetical protein VNN09_03225 [Candidatus Competibacteraceae bacterium]|nr:hypothetical protein [Candidatus Competibacteraceae bacterium]
MLDKLTWEDWLSCLNQPFRLQRPDISMDWELVQVTPWGDAVGRGRQPYTLLFRGPLRPLLPQGIQPLHHPRLGRVEIFLVPIGPDGSGGMRYEAVFT